MEEEYIGGSIFGKIETDDRITPDLTYCLYCYVNSASKSKGLASGTSIRDNINYKIPLDDLRAGIKQCPACKRIFILKNPIE